VIRLRAGGGGFGSRQGQSLSLRHLVQTDSGVHPAHYPMGIGCFSPRVKLLVRKTDHSPPFRAEVKNAWSHTFTPPLRHGLVIN